MPVGTRVRIPWQPFHDIPTWNETCAWAVEQFGLPGDKYTTHPTEDYMDFLLAHNLMFPLMTHEPMHPYLPFRILWLQILQAYA